MTMNLKFLLATGCITLGSSFFASAQDATPQNVLLNKAVIEVAGKPAADSEGPEKLIDGDLQTKYCIIQSNPFVVIDAQGYFQFSSFKFHDCQTSEDEENASAYKLELSMDGKTWQTAAEADGVAEIALKEINLDTPVKARYVRFSPTYNNCARMWELEGFGINATTLNASLQTDKIEVNVNADSEIKLNYSLVGEKASDFAISAEASKANVVEIGTANDADGVITIPVKGIAKGAITINVAVVNDGEVAAFAVPVKVLSDDVVSDAAAIEVSNWKTDIVAESLSADSFTGIQSGWSGYLAFYTASVEEEGALCDEEGLVETASGNVYKIPFNGANSVVVERYDPAFDLNFAQPVATETVNLLVFAKSYDGITLKTTLKYDDNSESDETSNVIKHWVYDENELDGTEALSGIGVVMNSYYDGLNVDPDKCYRFYEINIPADQYKSVKAISLSVDGGEYGDKAYVIGVNATDVNGQTVKHLNAKLAEKLVKVKQGSTANVVVNYTLTDIEGMSEQLTYSAVATKTAITLGEIVNDTEAHTLTIPVNGITPSIANVEVTIGFGEQTIKLSAQIFVKTTITGNTENCIEITDWNHDVIAEADPANDYSNQKLDDSGWVFFTDEVHPEGAIAGDERLVIAQSGNVYQLAPYDKNNATVIVGMGGLDVAHDFTFANPIYTDQINLLVTSANGESEAEITVNYEDGSKENIQNATVADWHAAEADGTEAVYGLGRIHKTNGDIAGERNFRLFEINASANRSSRVKSIKVNNKTYGSYLTVFGVNAKDMKTSGINDIATDNAGKTIVEYYNLQGQKVEHAENGLYIVRYADGTSAKVIIK